MLFEEETTRQDRRGDVVDVAGRSTESGDSAPPLRVGQGSASILSGVT